MDGNGRRGGVERSGRGGVVGEGCWRDAEREIVGGDQRWKKRWRTKESDMGRRKRAERVERAK